MLTRMMAVSVMRCWKAQSPQLKKAGGEVDLIDLNKDKFNPVMDEKDLVGFIKHEMIDPQSIDYVNRLKAADQLVLIFPIWWELMPAIMKGFIDKVFFPGSAYEYKKIRKRNVFVVW
jgi:NAD(P)H dehydrogenase (quinone)